MRENAISDALNDEDRYTLITSLLHSAFTRNEHGGFVGEKGKFISKISLSQLINRVFLLFQRPVVFVYYKKQKEGWILEGHTLNDPTFHSDFNNQFLNKQHTKNDQGKYILINNNCALTFRDIKLDNYAVGLIELRREEKNKKTTIVFNQCEKSNIYMLMFDRLISHFLDSSFSEEIGIIESIANPNKINAIAYYPSSNPEHWNIPHNMMHQRVWNIDGDQENNINTFTAIQINSIKKIINDMYESVSDDLIVSNSGKIPPNLFFNLRYYDPIDFKPENITELSDEDLFSFSPRYNGQYAYSLRKIIPSKQLDDLEETLKTIYFGRNSVKQGSWKYGAKDRNNNKIKTEVNGVFPNKTIDTCFWEDLEKTHKGNNYSKKILELEKPVSKNYRGISDPVFVNAFTHIRNNPFSGAGNDRIYGSSSPDWNNVDTPRIAYTYYLYAAAAKESKAETLSVMTIPLKISGTSYICITHVINTTDADFKSGTEWRRNYYFFAEVVRKVLRQLRKRMLREYLREIEKNFMYNFFDFFKNDSISIEELSSMVNDNYYNLCRVWPFAQIKIFVYDADLINKVVLDEHLEHIPLLNDGFYIAWDKLQNPFYLDSEEKYLSDKSISSTMSHIVQKIEQHIYYFDKVRN